MVQETRLGPPVRADFFVAGDHIVKITLSPASSASWAFIGPCESTLRESVDVWMDSYCNKEAAPVILPLGGLELYPPFTQTVLNELMRIPFGITITYYELAQRLGNPKAARAVGAACGRNPFPLVLPCHRVVAKNGTFGGFSCGSLLKQELLKHERPH